MDQQPQNPASPTPAPTPRFDTSKIYPNQPGGVPAATPQQTPVVTQVTDLSQVTPIPAQPVDLSQIGTAQAPTSVQPAPTPSPAGRMDMSSIYPTAGVSEPRESTASFAPLSSGGDSSIKAGVPLGVAIFGVIGAPLSAWDLFISVSNGGLTGHMEFVERLLQIMSIIDVFLAIWLLLMSNTARKVFIVAAISIAILQGILVKDLHDSQSQLSAYSSSSSSTSTFDSSFGGFYGHLYLDMGAGIVIQLAAVAYLIRPSAGRNFS